MEESTITSRGRTTLPKPVREALGVAPGDRVRYVILDDGVRILPRRSIESLFGALKSQYRGPPATLEDMDRAIAKGACEE
ncbi:MAG: type II toxin-antitoxin system PrlF family antitoxin [Gammaproteobacteria bacterium]|nr:type II toxin-antitoxin system PrlF family antitoxin [Gammaproteobacteria bacterium]